MDDEKDIADYALKVDIIPSTWEEDRQELETFINDLKSRNTIKFQSRQKNLHADDNRPDETNLRKLDSSLKKNTAFVKKLKSLAESQHQSLIRDFQGLNLSKYVAEVATAMVEVKLKMSDISCALEICSLAHQRYADFSSCLLNEWKKILPRKKSDKIVNPSKLRVDLRFFADLIVLGIFDEKEALPVLAGLLSYLINTDKEQHSNISLIISFCKFCGEDYAGLISRRLKKLSVQYNQPIELSDVFSLDRQKNVFHLLLEYFNSLTTHVVSASKEIKKMERHNFKILHTKGEVHPESLQRYENAKVAYGKLYQNACILADLLDCDLPKLPDDKPIDEEDGLLLGGMISQVEVGRGEKDGIEIGVWEDEDTRLFYESLPELRAMLPGILFKESEEATLPKMEENLVEDESEEVDDAIKDKDHSVVNDEQDEKQVAEEDAEPDDVGSGGDISGTTMKYLMDAFINSLPQQINRDMIDKCAIDFVTNLNTPINRKRLVKALFGVQRTRLDLLPFYSRLVAVLYPVMPDVGTELVHMLIKYFRYHLRKKDQIQIETKIKIVRFIGELVKFKICPKSEALHCLKMLLFDFQHHQIDMACNLLDVCGYFLYHSTDSHHKTRILLDQMMRKRQATALNQRYEMMIDNTYCQCNPPLNSSNTRVELPPMHQYVCKLLFKDLTKSNVEKILKQLRKLDWNDNAMKMYIVNCLSSPWRMRYNTIPCLASLLAGLMWYYDDVGHLVVDNILEDTRIGMELNCQKFNQRRIACIRYLGEMYNYRCVDSTIIFNTLYILITYGNNYDQKSLSVFDPPEHLLRIRLVCILLETCGHYFDRGSSRKKLDCYLVYLQRYYWLKRSSEVWRSDSFPFPLEIENILLDTIDAVRPKLKLCVSLAEAERQVKDIEDEYRERIDKALEFIYTNEPGDDVDDADNLEYQDERDLTTIDEREEFDQSASQSQDASQTSDHHQKNDNEESTDGNSERSDDDDVHVRAKFVEKHCPEDEDFMHELDKLIVESVQQRVHEAVKVPQADMTVPTNIRMRMKARFVDVGEDGAENVEPMQNDIESSFYAEESKPSDKMKFVLMTKGKGNKPSFKSLQVPIDSDMVQAIRVREAAEAQEKREMKQLTLNMQQRMEEEEREEAEQHIRDVFQFAPRAKPQPQQQRTLQQTLFNGWK